LLGIANLKKFALNKEKPGIIVLITDGDSNKGSDPIDAAKIAANSNIPIYVLAIGKSDYIV
jgi:secreted protein with Ig-like and vWFA domain